MYWQEKYIFVDASNNKSYDLKLGIFDKNTLLLLIM